MPVEESPNVVLIMSDQHNPHVMGCAGDPFVRTPNLDALAAEGAQFSNLYCPYPLCVPSRMAFLAARYPSEIGTIENVSILPSEIPTFAHSLGRRGYHAVLCGRMHFRGCDQFHGFEDRIFGECQTSAQALSPEILGSGPNRTDGQSKYAVAVAGYGQTGYRWADVAATQKAVEFIGAQRRGARPYCLVVGLMLPHNPLICDKALFDHYMGALPVPAPVPAAELAALHPALRAWRERRGVDDLTPEQNHRALAAYYGLISEVDRHVGAIVRAVRSSAMADNTVIIYCSDHGDMAYEHGMWWKCTFYEGSARVPCIISWPRRVASGKIVDAVASLIDVGPTVLDMCGAEPLPDASGRSMLPLLAGAAPPHPWPNEVYSEYAGLQGDQPSYMVRSGPWKFNYYHEFESYQLFNLHEDPQEDNDRAADPQCRTVAGYCQEVMRSRWSAQAMKRESERHVRAYAFIAGCGHDLAPYPSPPFVVPQGYNQFDFGQLAPKTA